MIDVMARKVSVVTTDDLDGSPDAGTVSFGLDGVSYEIDLVPANKTRLADAVARYIAAGRKVSRGRRGRERPVAMRGEPGEQLAEPLIGDAARDPLDQPGARRRWPRSDSLRSGSKPVRRLIPADADGTGTGTSQVTCAAANTRPSDAMK